MPVVPCQHPLWPSIELLSRDQLAGRRSAAVRGIGTSAERFVFLNPVIHEGDTQVCGNGYPVGFWRDLISHWAEAFDCPDIHADMLKTFYREFGPVTAFGVQNGYESIVAARRGITWFKTLVDLACLAESRDYESLMPWFKQKTDAGDNSPYFRATIPSTEGSETLAIIFLPNDSDERRAWPYPMPKDASDLALRVNRALAVAIGERLAEMRQKPTAGEAPSPWMLEPKGALNGAFLQWLATRLSVPLSCRGCNKPVPPGSRVWCSDRCRERVYKRRQRAKQRETVKSAC